MMDQEVLGYIPPQFTNHQGYISQFTNHQEVRVISPATITCHQDILCRHLKHEQSPAIEIAVHQTPKLIY